MNNPMNQSPVRRYRRQKGHDSLRYLTLLVMVLVIVVGLAVFIMSLTGTGLFSSEVPTTADSDGESEDDETSETTEETSEKPIVMPDDDITYRYVSMTPDDIHNGELLLIDATHPYLFPQVKMATIYGNKSTSYKVPNTSISMKLSVINEMNKMMDGFYEATGMKDAIVSSAYRSFNDQQALYDKNPQTAAIPGSSDYHTGASVMFQIYNETGIFPMSNRSESLWLKENAHKYGFTFRYPTDKKGITGYNIPWQMRYVGIPHATYMYDEFLCLEEYLTLLSESYRYAENHLVIECADGYRYEVFYVAGAAEGVIQVPVPENRDYTVSGDNIGGFIITVLAGVVEDEA